MPSSDTWSSQINTVGTVWEGRNRSWHETPNFGSLSEEARPINPYSDYRYKASAKPTTQKLKFKDGTVRNTWNYGWTLQRVYDWKDWSITPINSDWNSVKDPLVNKTKVKALVKVADAKVNLAVTYAEAHKTSDMILDAARRIDRSYRAFRRGNLREVARQLNITPGRVHKTWLEYKYGWLPLLMDVKGGAEFFAQQHVVRSPKFVVTARERVVKTYDRSENIEPWGGPPTHRYSSLQTRAYDVTARIWCELTSPHLSELQQLGLTNPALVAWELIPFSFVFDWFIQVGDWLTALTSLQGVTVSRAMVSSVETDAWIGAIPPSLREDSSYIYDSTGEEYAYSARYYERGPWSPEVTELYPPMTNGFDFPKLVTSLALIKGGYRGNARL